MLPFLGGTLLVYDPRRFLEIALVVLARAVLEHHVVFRQLFALITNVHLFQNTIYLQFIKLQKYFCCYLFHHPCTIEEDALYSTVYTLVVSVSEGLASQIGRYTRLVLLLFECFDRSDKVLGNNRLFFFLLIKIEKMY